MFTVLSDKIVLKFLTNHATGIPDNDVRLARLVLIIQEVVDTEPVGPDHFPYPLTSHLRFAAV